MLAPLLLGVLLAWMTWRAWRRLLPGAVLAGAFTAVLQFVDTAVGRVNGGDPTTSRYLYVGAALLLPAVALALDDVVRRGSLLRPLVAAAVLAMGGQSSWVLVHTAGDVTGQVQHSRQLILTAASLPAGAGALPHSLPDPDFASQLDTADARRLRERGDLQPLTSIPDDVAAEVRRRVFVEVTDGTAEPIKDIAVQVADTDGATVQRDGDCLLASNSGAGWFAVRLAYPGFGGVPLAGVTPVIVRLFLAGTAASPTDETQPFLLPPGDPHVITTSARFVSLVLLVSPGTVRLCP